MAKGSSTRRRRASLELVDAKQAVDLATAQTYSENVFLFVPNLIDGQAARALGQTSKFGAILDMVTDRCTTSCLLCYLSSAYPPYAVFFQFLIALDFSSHYMHMYSSLVTGSTSHKLVTSDVSRILWMYYNDPRTLFFVCAGNELFFVALYLIKWTSRPIGLSFLGNMTYPELMALTSFPIFFLKNVINVVQLWKASKILVGVDLAERAAARAAAIQAEMDEKANGRKS
ncbi:hypothetical protein NLJ89_g2830 [Agrocybe chaxingu]|uniref:CDP-diacylglycerol--inositol 3-phosphatidyltransferase n=1 Tax=Agrocybe chaxingu TaxID=84603 RepID=A0A9W8K623_9AGAR|nr:hypothetical protein NLJ89_g2830 [Agrocybe chaxingu]